MTNALDTWARYRRSDCWVPVYTQTSPLPPPAPGSVRFQLAGRGVIKNILRTRLAEAPTDKRILFRLGKLAAQDGNIEDAVKFLRQAAEVGCAYIVSMYYAFLWPPMQQEEISE